MTALRVDGTDPTSPPNKSSAWARSAACCSRRSRARLAVSSSSSESSLSPACRAFFSAIRVAMRSALDFLLALASASALALASSAFFAFSRSTSESSAASQESRTCLGAKECPSASWWDFGERAKDSQAEDARGGVLTSSSSSSSSNLRRPAATTPSAGELSEASSSSVEGSGQSKAQCGCVKCASAALVLCIFATGCVKAWGGEVRLAIFRPHLLRLVRSASRQALLLPWQHPGMVDGGLSNRAQVARFAHEGFCPTYPTFPWLRWLCGYSECKI